MTARLEIQNLVRSYNGVRVVDDVSLTIAPGKVTCLLGPSGCGKSTTLRMIAGVDMQDSGRIFVDGKLICDTKKRLPAEARNIGLMFQDFALFPHLDVGNNVAFGLKGGLKANRDRVEDLLEKVGMGRFIDHYPHQLSGGEQQRVALARALAPRPSVMMMDEPFSGLDDRLRDGIREETMELLRAENTSVLLVTHEPSEAMRVADNIALMRKGRIVQSGDPYHVYNAPIDLQAAAFFSDINVLQSETRGMMASTCFGDFHAAELADGTKVDIVFRPQHVQIDFDRAGRGPNPTERTGTPVRATVERSRFIGRQSVVDFTVENEGASVSAMVPGVFLPNPGTAMWLLVRRDRCFVFKCNCEESAAC